MGAVQSDQYINKQGMFHSIPMGYQLPYIPDPAIVFQGNIIKNHPPNFQSSVTPIEYPAVFGNQLDKMLSTSKKGLVADQSVIFQNIVNEKFISKQFHCYDSPNFCSRKKNRKKRNRRRVLLQVPNDAITNSSYQLRQQSHQGWNHVPRMDWSQSNSYTGPINMNVHNPFRSGSFDKRGVNPHRSQNLGRSEFTRSLCKSPGFTVSSGVAISRGNFKPHIPVNNCLEKNVKNTAKIKTRSKVQANSSTNSMNFANYNKSNKDDDDITYLFTVDSSSEEKIVLEIDLQSETTNLVPKKSSTEAVNLIKESRADVITVKKSESRMLPISRKRKLSNNTAKTNKRSSNQPRCTVCTKSYADIVGKNGDMYISTSCSHIFCHSCIYTNGSPKVCSTCGIGLLSFRRLFI